MIGALVVVCVAEAESMATAYPAARNLCAAVTYTRVRETALYPFVRTVRPHEDIKKKKKKQKNKKKRKKKKRKKKKRTQRVRIDSGGLPGQGH